MGSLISAPVVPNFISAPAPVSTTSTIASSNTSTAQAVPSAPEQQDIEDAIAAKTVEEKKTQQKERNLLTRQSRGRSATVLTSLRGLLDVKDDASSRKSLLGE